jgi:CBS domain-containing protein
MLDCDPALRAEEVMEPGPKTVRPHKSAAGVARQLAEKDLRWAVITTPEGVLIGVAARRDLEDATAAEGA